VQISRLERKLKMDGNLQTATRAETPAQSPWWRGAIVYQIYPRSYYDTNADGIGDLPGITAKLDHIASLGVAGIWISPFFKSPMKDFGYDVADYRAVDPIFGTLHDFDIMLAAAHARGLKVIIDMVMAHTSDLHAWFSESRASRQNAKADWYVWHDPKPDGTPPTNWQAVFGGAAWTWDARRQQYYMHNFLASQPQLNVHNRAVQDALLAEARFWLARGVDGFRLDAINHSMHDLELRDNPPWAVGTRTITRPFDMQHRVYSQSHPDIPLFLERFRQLTDEFGAVFSVAEVGGPNAIGEMKSFTSAGRLNSAYSFDFLYAPDLTPERVRSAQSNWLGKDEAGWPSWAFSNHDAPRCVSRWYTGDDRPRFARLTNALLLSLRGNPILYQGEELGLTQGVVPFEALQDPEAISNWPLTLGRDGARTPMAWSRDNSYGGFSAHKPWLPIGEGHDGLSVAEQEKDAASVLNFTRAMIAVRERSAALQIGDIHFLAASGALLVFERREGDEKVHCIFNLGAGSAPWPASVAHGSETLISSGWEAPAQGDVPAYSVWIGRA
jgi:alpha-glucosidase